MIISILIYFLAFSAFSCASSTELKSRGEAANRPYNDKPLKIAGSLSFLGIITTLVLAWLDLGWGYALLTMIIAAALSALWAIPLKKADTTQRIFILFSIGLICIVVALVK